MSRMMVVAEFTSKVTIARPKSSSLRTTIPEGVAKMIDLKAGEDLVWKVVINGGKIRVIVSKRQ